MTIGQALNIFEKMMVKSFYEDSPTFKDKMEAYTIIIKHLYKNAKIIPVILESKGVETDELGHKIVYRGTLLYINKNCITQPVAHINHYDNDICIGEIQYDADVTDGSVIVSCISLLGE